LIYGQDRLFIGDIIDYFPWIVLGVSLLASLAWYVTGEWGIRPHASVGVWYTVWFVLLALVVVTAAVVAIYEPTYFQKDSDIDTYWWLHLAGGIGFYYLSSVLFSPSSAKYLIWPAKYIRTW
jgi:hypothetical protein